LLVDPKGGEGNRGRALQPWISRTVLPQARHGGARMAI